MPTTSAKKLAWDKAYRERHKEELSQYFKDYYQKNKATKRAYDRVYQARNMERRRQQAKEWYWNNKSKKQEYDNNYRPIKNRKRREAYRADPQPVKLMNKKSHRKRHLKKYGLTELTFQALLEAQDCRCACCGRDRPGAYQQNWNIDHDHRTGLVRGILCGRCNRAIGQLGDTLEGVSNAIKYLSRHYKSKDTVPSEKTSAAAEKCELRSDSLAQEAA